MVSFHDLSAVSASICSVVISEGSPNQAGWSFDGRRRMADAELFWSDADGCGLLH
jgi:hypothetical protein